MPLPSDWLQSQFDNAIDAMQPKSLDDLEKRISKLNSQNRYTEKYFLAQGGMKTISKVYDELTGRTGAMAELRDPEDQISRELFIREAHLNAILQHPNILQIYDFGFNSASNPYFTMKLLRGKPLNKYLLSTNLRLNRNTLLTKFVSICEAIAFAHSCGIMHLDLKPRNIWIGDFDETLVMDWGLSKIFESSCDERLLSSEIAKISGATIFGIVRGTPGFMSPEQATKKSAITYNSDIFSLGAILYKILTGKTPFVGNSNEEIIRNTQKCIWQQPSDLPSSLNIPDSLEAIIVKALSKEPKDRYDSASQLAGDVKSYLNGFATTAENAGIFKQLSLQYMRNRKVYNLIFFFVILISSVTAVSVQTIQKRTEMAGRHEANTKLVTAELQKEQHEKQQISLIAADELFNKGKIHFAYGRFTKSITTFKEAMRLGKKTPELHHYLSGLYIQSGEFGKIKEQLKEAKKTSEEGSFIHNETTKVLRIFNRIFQRENFSLDNIMLFSHEMKREKIVFYANLIEVYLFNYPMSLELKIKYVDGLIRATNRRNELTVIITKSEDGVKVDLSNNASKLIWGYGIHILPVIELDISNTSYKLDRTRPFPNLKKLDMRNCKFKKLSLFGDAPLEELYVSEEFKECFKYLVKITTLKKVYVPNSFKEQKDVVENLEKTVEIIFE